MRSPNEESTLSVHSPGDVRGDFAMWPFKGPRGLVP